MRSTLAAATAAASALAASAAACLLAAAAAAASSLATRCAARRASAASVIASASAMDLMTAQDYKYMEFVTEQGRSYATVAEYNFRSEIFKANLALIEEHNAAGNTWTLGVHMFMDYTKEEMKKLNGWKSNSEAEAMEETFLNTAATPNTAAGAADMGTPRHASWIPPPSSSSSTAAAAAAAAAPKSACAAAAAAAAGRSCFAQRRGVFGSQASPPRLP